MTAEATPVRKRFGMTVQERSQLLWALLFLSPWIVGFVVFTAGPMIWSGWLSLTDYDPLRDSGTFIGVDNYVRMAGDRRVGISLWNTTYFTLLYVPLSIGLSLLLASLLNRTTGR